MVPGMRRCTALLSAVLIGSALPLSGQVSSFSIFEVGLDSSGRASVKVSGDEGFYYVLVGGDEVDRIENVLAVVDGFDGETELIDPSPPDRMRFYQVLRASLSGSMDLDGDGIRDADELRFPRALDPLNPVDAMENWDGDFLSNMDEILEGSDPEVAEDSAPPVGIASVSPRPGETGVSPDRRLVVRLSTPVDIAMSDPSSAVEVSTPEGSMSGVTSLNVSGDKLTFVPDSAWPQGSRIQAVFFGDALVDSFGAAVDADGDGFEGGALEFEFEILNLERVPGTTLFGFVRDSYSGEPIPGVTMRVDGLPEADAVTDESGRFEIVDAPAPAFFVHIDGSTAVAPPGMVYPVVGKPFHSVAGETVQLNHHGHIFDVFLPPMSPGDVEGLLPDDVTNVGFGASGLTALQTLFPEVSPDAWARMSVTFPPGSAVDDLGNASTQAALIPVPPDRLPAPLPAGVDPGLVISIQAFGATSFDTPAPVTFPNLEGLPPGAKSAILSFNHSTGHWESVGTGTVSEDGLTVASDPGVGILAPGWHAVAPVVPINGPIPQVANGNGTVGPIVGSPPCPPLIPPPPPPIALTPDPLVQFWYQVPDAPDANASATTGIYLDGGLPVNGSGLGGIVCINGGGGLSPAEGNPPSDLDPTNPFSLTYSVRQSDPESGELVGLQPGYLMVADDDTVRFEIINSSLNIGPRLKIVFRVEGPAERAFTLLQDFDWVLEPGQLTTWTVGTRPLAALTNPQNVSAPSQLIEEDLMISAKATLQLWNADKEELVESLDYFFVRYVDAGDSDTDDGVLDFIKAPPGNERVRTVDVFPEPEFFANDKEWPYLLRGEPGTGFHVGVDVDIEDNERWFNELFFRPTEEGIDQTTPLLVTSPSGGTIGTLTMRGDSDITRYFLDEPNLIDELANAGSPYSADDLLSRIRNDLTTIGLESFAVETSDRGAADIVVEFDQQSFSDTWSYPYVASDTHLHALKDFDFGFNPNTGIASVIARRPTFNRLQAAYVLADALNRRVTNGAGASGERLRIPVDVSAFAPLFEGAGGTASLMARYIVQGIGFHLGQVETFVRDGDNRVFIVDGDVLDCPLGQFDVMGGENIPGGSICIPDAWAAAVGSASIDQIENAFGYFVSYYDAYAPLLQSYFTLAGEIGRPRPIPLSQIPGVVSAQSEPLRPASAMVWNPSLVQVAADHEFGLVEVGALVESPVFELKNFGDESLTVLDVTFRSGGAITWTSDIPDGTVIQAGEAVEFSVAFSPDAPGEHGATIEFETDGEPGRLVFHVRGTGVDDGPNARLEVVRNNVGGEQFGGAIVEVGGLILSNKGVAPLEIVEIAVTEGAEHFGVGFEPVPELATNESLEINIVFHPRSIGLLGGQVEIHTNDPYRPTLRVPVVGTGFDISGPSPVPGNDIVLVETGSDKARTRSDADGSYFAFLPPERLYQASGFDPESGLVWSSAGTSAPAGEPTMLSQASFRVSRSNDLDFNGVPDEVDQILGQGQRFDFGPETANVAVGYQGVSPRTHYTLEQGFGWTRGVVGGVDRSADFNASPVEDFVETRDATFVVDLEDGIYEVTTSIGDRWQRRAESRIVLEGEERGNVRTEYAQVAVDRWRVAVRDGQLTIRVIGSTDRVALASLGIERVGEIGGSDDEELLEGRFFLAIEDLNTGAVTRDSEYVLAGGRFADRFFLPGDGLRIWVAHASTQRVGFIDQNISALDAEISLPRIELGLSNTPDSDSDGLTDILEFIVGTDANNQDSDGDGVNDFEEFFGPSLDPECVLVLNEAQTGLLSTGAETAVNAFVDFTPAGTAPELHAVIATSRFHASGSGVRVSRHDGGAWHPLPGVFEPAPFDIEARDAAVLADLVTFDGRLHAAGRFETIDGTDFNSIGAWDGSGWLPLGEGLPPQFGQPVQARAMEVYDDGSGEKLVVGGFFELDLEFVDGIRADAVSVWDGDQWTETFAATLALSVPQAGVQDMVVYDDGNGPQLIVAGVFDTIGGAPASGIAAWNGAGWTGLSDSTSASLGAISVTYPFITSLAVFGGELYAAGLFTEIDGVQAEGIARWNGQTWSALGGDVQPLVSGNEWISTLAVASGSGGSLLVAGGNISFGGSDGAIAGNLAAWDGSRWAPIGLAPGDYAGPGGEIRALHPVNGGIIGGGRFIDILEDDLFHPANGAALWDLLCD